MHSLAPIQKGLTSVPALCCLAYNIIANDYKSKRLRNERAIYKVFQQPLQ